MNRVNKLVKLIDEYAEGGFKIENGMYQMGNPNERKYYYIRGAEDKYELVHVIKDCNDRVWWKGTLEETLIALLAITYGTKNSKEILEISNKFNGKYGRSAIMYKMDYPKLKELLEMANIEEEYYSEEGRLLKDTQMIKYDEEGLAHWYAVLGDDLKVEEIGAHLEDTIYFYKNVFLSAYRKKSLKLINQILREEDIADKLPKLLEKFI